MFAVSCSSEAVRTRYRPANPVRRSTPRLCSMTRRTTPPRARLPTTTSAPPSTRLSRFCRCVALRTRLCCARSLVALARVAANPPCWFFWFVIGCRLAAHVRARSRALARAPNAQLLSPSSHKRARAHVQSHFEQKNLFEQFRRLTNFYFLLITIITLLPEISPITPLTTVLALVFVLR